MTIHRPRHDHSQTRSRPVGEPKVLRFVASRSYSPEGPGGAASRPRLRRFAPAQRAGSAPTVQRPVCAGSAKRSGSSSTEHAGAGCSELCRPVADACRGADFLSTTLPGLMVCWAPIIPSAPKCCHPSLSKVAQGPRAVAPRSLRPEEASPSRCQWHDPSLLLRVTVMLAGSLWAAGLMLIVRVRVRAQGGGGGLRVSH